MTYVGYTGKDTGPGNEAPVKTDRDAELKEKAEEMTAFLDAGVLSKAEYEEQMAKARWRLP